VGPNVLEKLKMNRLSNQLLIFFCFLMFTSSRSGAEIIDERPVMPQVTVAHSGADFNGSDNRALQSAVDFVGGLGGGVVVVGPGEYVMHDSLHLRSFVKVRGTPGKTIFRKEKGNVSSLAWDGDYGEDEITVTHPTGFNLGGGVTIWDANSDGFHATVARLTGRKSNTFTIDRSLNADYTLNNNATAATVFSIVSGENIEGTTVEDLIIDGNKTQNPYLTGCRGAGIYLYRSSKITIRKCTVRDFNGDGISFQKSNDVLIEDCTSERNATSGIHAGSGSERPLVRGCVMRGNNEDGLFICWRVRHGMFEKNKLEGNVTNGISIGHKDSDNVIRFNSVRENGADGILFREENMGLAGHRNLLEGNVIENNGSKSGAAGIRIGGQTNDTILKDNIIQDMRPLEKRYQTVGIEIGEKVGPTYLDNNAINAPTKINDKRLLGVH
jgi:parallel beta-helix repeat protein